jgi:long-chain acyl-CoA synthetase
LATVLDNGAGLRRAGRGGCSRRGIVHVPLPQFFTPAQMQHALQASAGVDTLLVSAPLRVAGLARAHTWWPMSAWRANPDALRGCRRSPWRMPPGTAKMTFTSGTTGAPKGVCLSGSALRRVADGLVEAMAPLGIERHLNALPFPVLLENIAGVMAPRLHGAT